jgi:hypothetical protein
VVVSLAVTLALAGGPGPAMAQFYAQVSHPRHILEGHWQSCQEPGGGPYAERVYDHVVNGVGQFEVHLGPRHEFAMFLGVQDEHRGHSRPDNLLRPYEVPLEGARARHRWEIPALGLAFNVALGGGGRVDCESWFVLLEPLDQTSD